MASGGLDTRIGLAAVGPPIPDAALVVVTAHRGAGKTTLLRQWYDQESSNRDHQVVWFDVEPADNDPGHLRSRLEPLVGSEATPSTVFVDDFEVVQSSASRRAMVELVEQGSGSTRFVVAQKPANRLPVARLRADDLVAELGDVELRFDEHHLEQLFAQRELALSDQERARLLEETEGWASGIAAVIETLAATDGDHEEGLIDGVLINLGQEMAGMIRSAVDAGDYELLVATSILDELEPELCREVAGSAPSVDLERMASRTPFLGRFDDESGRFRLHRLARRGLEAELVGGMSADVIQARHKSAADWLEANGDFVAAFEHSLAAGLPERAADLLAVRWSVDTSAVSQSDLATVGQATAGNYVPHTVTTALVRGQAGDHDALDQAVDRLAAAEWLGPLPHGFATLDSAIVALNASHARHQGRAELERIVEVVTRDEMSPAEPRNLIGQGAAATALYLLGRFDEARIRADAILLGHRSVGRHTVPDRIATVRASDLYALLEYDLGRIEEARSHLIHSDELEKSYGIPVSIDLMPPAATDRRLVKAVVGDEEVGVRIDDLTRLSVDGSPTVRLHAAIELARLLDRDRQVAEGLKVLEQTKAWVQGIQVPPLLSQRLDLLEEALRPRRRTAGPFVTITVGERSVLYLLADTALGQSEISAQLGLSINTIKSHVRSIYQKLGVTGRGEAVAYAADLGLLATVLPWGEPHGKDDSHPG